MEGMELDVDQELTQKFSCMGTTDKDILISEFQRLLGFQLNPAGCAFFLDMTNWNLQAAIGAYYDFESPNISAPCMSLVKDVTIGEGESVPPDTRFTKTWRIQNTAPQEMTDVSVPMQSPVSPGMYQGQWRMCTATGLYYGDIIWVILSVEVGGLLGVTQQLSSFQAEFNTQPHRNVEGNYNPFASPERSKWPNSNTSLHHDSSHKVSEEHWQGSPNQLQQDQNGLSHSSVDIVANSLQSNLSIVTYNQGLQEPSPFGHS
ncbi:protein ILRUN-like isoform X2 [Phyllopteryx taeniolatus]|uniref:protein ILRUN-like isoform X2 n=1 Tax=Phyllopteryx taeniolatus TaxID=161469 RepID=UPI002AD521EC|nr:protein ILRUN-like isoform X2 [Phyllopteryx taeniolatus]